VRGFCPQKVCWVVMKIVEPLFRIRVVSPEDSPVVHKEVELSEQIVRQLTVSGGLEALSVDDQAE
jgi:hypothetical protein